MQIINLEELDKSFIIKRGCVKCRHQWFPRSSNPQRCPRCQVWLDKPVKMNNVQKYENLNV